MSDSPFAEFAAGAAILREGEPARAMYIIESGRVEIRSSSSPLPLAELGPGEVIGEMALLQEQPHSATATARTAVRALCIDQAAFHAVLRENPEVAVQLMRQLVLRLRAAEQRSGGAAPAPPRAPASAAASSPAAASMPATGAPAARPARPAAAPAAPVPASPVTPVPAPAAPTPLPPAPERTAPPQRAAVDTGVPAAASPLAPPARPAAAPPPPSPGAASPAAPAPAAATGPVWSMRHAQGEISLAPQRDEWLIGRPDPATGQVPEIDLGALDVARSLSRRHARLRREGAQLLLREEPGVANGTWINGERLAAGAAVPLRPGDRLRFGAVEVEFVAR